MAIAKNPGELLRLFEALSFGIVSRDSELWLNADYGNQQFVTIGGVESDAQYRDARLQKLWETLPVGHESETLSGVVPVEKNGLKATFYAVNDAQYTTPLAHRLTPVVDYDWGVESPHPAVPERRSRIVYEGSVTTQFAGLHYFSLATIYDAVRVYVNDEPLVDTFDGDYDEFPESLPIELEQGQTYPIRVEYAHVENLEAETPEDNSTFNSLRWRLDGANWGVIPSSQLTPPAGYAEEYRAIAPRQLPNPNAAPGEYLLHALGVQG